jgi:hypothetical protein
MSGVSAKRALITKINFDESLSNGQDWDFFVRSLISGAAINNISTPLFDYRKNTPEGIGEKTRKMKPHDADKRLESAYKHRSWLGENNFKNRVAHQLLTFLPYKKHKIKWILKSIEHAGIWVTLKTVVKKVSG